MSCGLIMKHLAIVAAFVCLVANAQPVQIGQDAGNRGLQPVGRSIFDEYTLGQPVDGAKIIYTYQFVQSYDGVQNEIALDFDYPSPDDGAASNPNTISQITLYVEAANDAVTQAYVNQGGIGANTVSLQIVAQNSDFLRYMIIIYGV